MTETLNGTLGDTRSLRERLLSAVRIADHIDLADYGIEGGGPATIRGISGRERRELFAYIKTLSESDKAKGTAAVVAVGLGDMNGAPVFTLADVEAIDDQLGTAVAEALAEDILDANGLSDKAREDTEKNSEPAATNGSGTL